MDLNRTLIKKQAKDLLRGKILPLFLVSFIVLLLSGGTTTFNSIRNSYDTVRSVAQGNDYSSFGDFEYPHDDHDDADDFENWLGPNNGGNSDSDNPIENFGGQIAPLAAQQEQAAQINGLYAPYYVMRSIFGAFSSLLFILTIVFSAMRIILDGYYVTFIRTGREIPIGADLAGLFKTTFDVNYGKRLVLSLLRDIFTALWSLLLIIPGIVYFYSVYFAFEIMADHPNMKPMQALRLSKKMVYGHRSELFVLDLSFILWWLLVICTFGIAGIYVIPYYRTTKALYYENFRLRALATGLITEDDFLSDQEIYAKYGAARGYYGAPNGNAQAGYAPQGGAYYTPQGGQPYGPTQPGSGFQQTPPAGDAYSSNTYYTPPQAAPKAPFAGAYTPGAPNSADVPPAQEAKPAAPTHEAENDPPTAQDHETET